MGSTWTVMAWIKEDQNKYVAAVRAMRKARKTSNYIKLEWR